mgnify:CR=1 FL=1
MGSRSGGGKIINWRKVKSGYDQEFTLPKGASPTPIKQVNIQNTYTNPKPVKHITEVQRVKAQILRDKTNPKTEIIKGKVVGQVSQNWGKWKPVYQNKQYIKAKQREVGNIEYVFKNGKWVQVN